MGAKRLGLGLVVLFVAGCGTKTVVVTTATTTVTGSAASATTPAPPATSSATSTAVTSASAGTTVELSTFRSPSSNIGCDVVNQLARCDISHRDWSPPPHPASCPQEVDYGQGLQVGISGPGQFVCAGDTALDPQAPAIPYGDAAGVGPFVCSSSATAGFTCTNRNTGHGFTISIQSYRTF